MKNASNQPIAILGAGSWGTALALSLTRSGHPVRLWTQEPDRIAAFKTERANNRYLPGYAFPDSLTPVADLCDAIKDNCDILIAVPSAGFRDLLLKLKPLLSQPRRLIWATKGLDLNTGQLLHEVIQDILGTQHEYAILSGPSFAKEVAAGLPTAVVIASHQPVFAKDMMNRFNNPVFRVYLSTDITGVEIGGAVKNVLAIAAGMCDGMQLGANARCALITRGLAEMTRLGLALGGQYETFTGLAGLGDLILTCTDNLSRNRRFGLALGAGKTVTDAEREIGQVIEGKRNAELVIQLAERASVEMPITDMVQKIFQEKISLQEAMQQLLSRAPKFE
jgi:glycerol-3-phosphate dehydrogenase (NAD(P)+)